MNNDFLNNLANGLVRRRTAVLVRLGESPFQVPHLVTVGVRRIRMEFNCGRGDGGNLDLDLVALSLQSREAVAQGAAWGFGQQIVVRLFVCAVSFGQSVFAVVVGG